VRPVRRFLPPVALAAAILTMSGPWGSSASTGGIVQPLLERLGLSPEAAAAAHAVGRSVGHVLAYALFAVLALRAARGDGPPTRRGVALSWTVAVGLAVLDETLQSLGGARSPRLSDVGLDALGAALGLALALRRARRSAPPPSSP
jgi:VanZ family protein